jgi:hypothetical protein
MARSFKYPVRGDAVVRRDATILRDRIAARESIRTAAERTLSFPPDSR